MFADVILDVDALLQFVALSGLVMLVSIIPVVKLPFQWLEVYYHELSHGLAALLTGGQIGRIKLNWDGSGWCTTRGGNRFFILIMGYTGAILWGAYLYFAGWSLTAGTLGKLTLLELGVILFTIVFYVRDLLTVAILLFSATTYALPLVIPAEAAPYLGLYFQFTGLYVLWNAFRAPFHLIDGKHVGDGAALADLFAGLLPEIVWIALWISLAVLALTHCALLTVPGLGSLVPGIG